ncbi:MAG: hypothetical protein HRU25_13285 [Psychrobium sp.]|nr:hypothetical protein [Psychrobium sp.]
MVGASCGGRQAQILARNNPVKALAFFSSAVVSQDDEKDKADYQATLGEIATLFISSQQDGTFAGTQECFSLNEHAASTFISYRRKRAWLPFIETRQEFSIFKASYR